uniref:Uncharacterized protein n=1 Tax=Mycena chlorophos TaxID=658473 RepID=A0ABQ0LRJ7_MYCCL|nr:predicted protein [Mycena chlorophos]
MSASSKKYVFSERLLECEAPTNIRAPPKLTSPCFPLEKAGMVRYEIHNLGLTHFSSPDAFSVPSPVSIQYPGSGGSFSLSLSCRASVSSLAYSPALELEPSAVVVKKQAQTHTAVLRILQPQSLPSQDYLHALVDARIPRCAVAAALRYRRSSPATPVLVLTRNDHFAASSLLCPILDRQGSWPE